MISLRIKNSTIFLLLAVNFLVRLLITLLTNLGIDEVYYVQYALNPSMSYFDHPPLVGWIIRLFTFNLNFVYNDFFVRLGPLIIGTLNLFVIYKIGVLIKNKAVGFVSALIYSSSFYTSILVGTFILPDTPLSFFWLLSILLFLQFISKEESKFYLLYIFGISVGFGLASKYQAIFLWFGAGLYFLFYNRKIFLNYKFWCSVIISLLIFSPIIYWNLTSEYSGVNYHSERVGSSSWLPKSKYFFPELFGQIFYNNPFVVILAIIATIRIIKIGFNNMDKKIVFLLLIGVPIIIVVLLMSFYNRTLPHWSGPGYFSLILITSYYCIHLANEKFNKKASKVIIGGVIFFYMICGLALIQIKNVFIPFSENSEIGKNNFAVDLGHWENIAYEIKDCIQKHNLNETEISSTNYILTHNWFPAAHIDYYYALPNKMKLYVLGNYKKQHEYLKINKLRGAIPTESSAFYITTSNYFQRPDNKLLDKFESFNKLETIPLEIKGKTIANIFIWKLNNLKEEINFNKPQL